MSLLGRALSQVDSWDVPLRAVAAIDPGMVVTSHGDVSQRTRIASVSKPLFAYGVLIAIEEGLFGLDDPLGPYGSTVRHLLAHASGLPFVAADPNRTVPGTRRVYSNAGFDLLGRHLAERAGMSCADYLRVGVFEPLGMNSTSLEGSVARDVWSTVNDLSRFACELLKPTLVDRSSLVEAVSVQFPDLAGVLPDFGMHRPCPWGLGFEIRGYKRPHWTGSTNSETTFGHFGATGSFLWVDPARDVALICLTDRQFGDWAKALWPALSDAVLAGVR